MLQRAGDEMSTPADELNEEVIDGEVAAPLFLRSPESLRPIFLGQPMSC